LLVLGVGGADGCQPSNSSTDGTDTGAADTGAADTEGDPRDNTDDNARDVRDAAPDSDNLLTNPDFEQEAPSDGCPAAWTCVTYNPADSGDFSVSESTAHSGQASASWSGSDTPSTVIKQRVGAEPGHRYDFTVWVDGESLETAPFVQILFEDADGELLTDQTFEADGPVDEWTAITGTTMPVPPGTAEFRFNLASEQTGDTIRWDAAALVDRGEADPGADAGDTGDDAGDVRDAGDLPHEAETIGGGEAYVAWQKHRGEPTFCGSSAGDVVVQGESVGELESALARASAGDVVYVPGHMEIDMGFDASVHIPAGVTLAGNRGCNGASGARLYTEDKPNEEYERREMFRLKNDDVRITGLRLEGPYQTQDTLHPLEKLENRGIVAVDVPNLEIDNVEMWNFMKAAIRLQGAVVHLHHSSIHHNNQNGWGYGISAPDWKSVIEYNAFDYNRHAIAGTGEPDQGYVVRYNVFGDSCLNSQQRMDQHGHPDDGGTGGHAMKIYRNTIRDTACMAVAIRGEPEKTTPIRHNWFSHNEGDALSLGDDGQLGRGHPKFDVRDNHYGRDEPSCDVGAPRTGCP